MKQDVAEKLTNWFLKSIDTAGPWVQPWRSGNAEGRLLLPRKHDGQPYKGVNVPLLWMAAQERGYMADRWMTYNQAKALGGQVRKGETSSPSVFFDKISKTETNDNGHEEDKSYRLMRVYSVFNADQVDGLPEAYYRHPDPVKLTPVERIEWAEQYLDNCGADVRWGGSKAFYNRGGDYIQMPLRELFNDAVSMYGTRMHETSHWAESRVGIDFERKGFGSHGYALGEITAELAASFWAAEYGVELEPRPDHAAYVAGWRDEVSEALRSSNRAILVAAASAQRIVDYTDSLQPAKPT